MKPTHPPTEGNLALKGEPTFPSPRPVKRPSLRLVDKDASSRPEQPGLRLKQLVVAIGVSLSLCLLWILFVFILYRIVRATL